MNPGGSLTLWAVVGNLEVNELGKQVRAGSQCFHRPLFTEVIERGVGFGTV